MSRTRRRHLCRRIATCNRNPAAVVPDHRNGWTAASGAPFGLHHSKNTSDDNVTAGEVLTITFDQRVNLTRTDLRSEGYNFNAWGAGKTFLLYGVSTSLPLGSGYIDLNLGPASVCRFAFGGINADQFYRSAMTAFAVPEPKTYALMLAGLGAIGFMARRRSQAA